MRLSIYNSGRKGSDYSFIDRTIAEFFGAGGVACLVHAYLGPYLGPTAGVTANGTTVPAYDPNNPTVNSGGITTIQDPVLGEIRDRKYSPVTIELRGIYNLNDLDFDLRQFGLFLSNDTLYIEFHLGEMIARLGRKLMPGDVIELPHRRDTGIDPAQQVATNKFYLVEDASRASDGYSVTWWPHIWRVKVSPMPAGQEYADILNQPATDPLGLPLGGIGQPPITVGSVLSRETGDAAINQAIDDQAKRDVKEMNFETQQYYMMLPETGADYPWVFAGDGVPPDGAVLLGSGTKFPKEPDANDYYLRTDYTPQTLFRWDGHAWRVQEQNFRPDWSMARSLIRSFINNDAVTVNDDGTSAPEKISLSRVVRPRADF